jgi:hypothetical protein
MSSTATFMELEKSTNTGWQGKSVLVKHSWRLGRARHERAKVPKRIAAVSD